MPPQRCDAMTPFTPPRCGPDTLARFTPRAWPLPSWMDDCNLIGYQVLAEIEAGTRGALTVDEYLALLPELVLP